MLCLGYCSDPNPHFDSHRQDKKDVTRAIPMGRQQASSWNRLSTLKMMRTSHETGHGAKLLTGPECGLGQTDDGAEVLIVLPEC